MLYFPNTRIELSLERPVAAGVVIDAEGMGAVADYTGGVFGVKPSTGAVTDKFVGVTLNRVIDMLNRPNIEGGVVAANAQLLAFAPQAGTLRVINATTDVAFTVVVGAPAAGEVQIDTVNPKKLNFNAADNGVSTVVYYKYALTVAQAITIQGMQDPGGPAGRYLGQIGLITRGDVYTDQFDTTSDWTVVNPVLTLGPNGQFQQGGAGVQVPCSIIALPVVGAALLGFHVNAD